MRKLRIASLIAAVILVLGVQTLFGACGPAEDGSFMNCHYAQLDVFFIGIVLAVLALAAVLIKKRAVCLILFAASAILSVITILIPGTIVHMCMMDTMRCYTLLKPFTTILCIVILILSVLNLILIFRANNMKKTR